MLLGENDGEGRLSLLRGGLSEEKKEPPAKRWAVAGLMVNQHVEGQEGHTEFRLAIITDAEGADEEAAEWLGTKFFSGDKQLPKGFILHSVVAQEIK
jgi:hypothetical protein